MSGGTEFSEATEAPLENKEVEVNPEKQTEIKEAAEVQKETDEATHTPEASKEKMEHAPAEDLEAEFKAVMDAVPDSKEPGSDADIAGYETDDDSTSDSEESGSESSGTESEKQEEPMAAGVQVEAAEISQEASSELKTEAATKADMLEAAQKAKDGPRAAAEVAGAESVEASQSAASLEKASLDGKGGDDPEMVMVSTDGEDDGPELDDGLEQVVDLHQPTRNGGDPGDEMWAANQGEGIGNLAGINDLEPGSEVELPDPRSPGGGKGPGELGGPNIGTDRMGDLGDLSAAAAFGANDRISEGDEKPADGTDPVADKLVDDDSSDGTDKSEADSDTSHGVDGGTVVSETYIDANEAKIIFGRLWDGITSLVGDTAAAPDKPEFNAVAGIRGYDPEGDTGSTPTGDDEIEAALRAQGLPTADPNTVDLAESMMQPDGEESNRERPREDLQAAMEGGNVDSYAQYTGEEQETPDVIPEKELEDERVPIDPPEITGGGEQGFMEADSSKKNLANSEESADLNAADLNDGLMPDP